MGIKRYELDEAQWPRIALLLPGKARDPGRTFLGQPFVRERLFVGSAIGRALARLARTLWQVEDGSSAFQPVVPCRRVGTRVRHADRDNKYLMLDSTIVRAHQQAATGKGGNPIQAQPQGRYPSRHRHLQASKPHRTMLQSPQTLP